MKNLLRLGIPKGSLEAATIELFGKSGWRIRAGARSYFPSVDDEDLRLTLVRAQEMARYVEAGTLDAGVTGHDWILENAAEVELVRDLVYSKTTLRPTRWVLVVPMDSPVKRIEDLKGKKIATELVNYTKRYFAQRKVSVEVEFSWGATEAKAAEGLVDAIVEVTETGSTIRANGLRIVEELFTSNPQLIANKHAWQDEWKRKKIEQIGLLLGGALAAQMQVGLKLNVAGENLDAIVKMLPSITAPTVSNLYGKEWFSIESVVSENTVRDIIPKLIAAGAVGIIEYPLNKVI